MPRTIGPKEESLSAQMKNHSYKPTKEDEELFALLDGNFKKMTSTGSTLLDLAISGLRVRGGGLPSGIVLEAFGPSQSGKTVFLSEIAGNIQKRGGQTMFHDPEARLDKQFASMFGMKITDKDYFRSDTVTEVFKSIRKWKLKNEDTVNGVFADSLAALSTDMEMEEEDGDKMGTRRAKEFSQELRKTARMIKEKNIIVACSNQIRENIDAAKTHAPKYTSPGGMAFKFYASVRCRFNNPEKIQKEITVHGKKIKQVVGVETEIEVVKTTDVPFRKAPLTIIFDYGIDDIRQNLQYIKDYTDNNIYTCCGVKLDKSMEASIRAIESDNLEKKLRNEVIDLWEEIQTKFASDRKPKRK